MDEDDQMYVHELSVLPIEDDLLFESVPDRDKDCLFNIGSYSDLQYKYVDY